MLRYTVRPISDRTWQRPADARVRSPFDTSWATTLDDLERELNHLRAHDLIIEVDVQEYQIRNDGGIKGNAAAASPAVVVAFDTPRHGAMLYRSDRYTSNWKSRLSDWQHNVRAVALTLAALRAVDRYGATETGQQYTGFKALPPAGIALGAGMSKEQAAAFVAEHADPHHTIDRDRLIHALITGTWVGESPYRAAAKALHPDTGGDVALFQKLQDAQRILEAS